MTRIFGIDSARDQILSDDELKELASKMKNANLMLTTQAALWIALGTSCRLGDVLSAEWQHVGLDHKESRMT